MPSLIPRDDPKQALRIRRFLMAAGSYFMWAVLVAYCAMAGFFRPSGWAAAVWFLGGILVLNVAMYVVFRAGWNKRFRDPSLTVLQMAIATVVVMVTLYVTGEDTKGAFMLIYPVVFVFGFFRLRLHQFALITLLALTGYVASVWFVSLLHPGTVSLPLEILRFIILTLVLVWFSMVGTYVTRLRREVVDANTELKHALSTIEEMAIRDPLSGVYNRRKLMEILAHEAARAERGGPAFAVCLFDMDHFKKVNDTYGHLQGDAVLREFAQEMSRRLRVVDCIARYGGEEFVVVLPQTDLEGARTFAERALSVTRRLRLREMPDSFRITASAGVTVFKRGLSVDALFSLADQAMYRAKAAGRDRVETELP